MINFYINGEQVEVQLENEKTLGDVLTSFEQTCEENNAAVIGIIVDGKQITAEIFDSESSTPIENISKIEISMVTAGAIKESFSKLSILFEKLAVQMEQVPVSLQNGKNIEVSESIKTLADSIDQFCHIAALASLFPETFTKKDIEGVNFKEFFDDFAPILKDFEEALQNNDTVMIGDLSEYEICPRLKNISISLKSM